MQALRDIVLDKKFLKSLVFYTRFRHTGKLEAYHSHRLMYAPKRFGFSYEGLFARSLFAAIDHNHHLHRKQARNKRGELVYSRRWSKRAKRWKVVIVKEQKNYSYLPLMCAEVLKEVSKQPMKKVQPLTYEHDPKKIAPTIASLPAPPTSELVKEHLSRF